VGIAVLLGIGSNLLATPAVAAVSPVLPAVVQSDDPAAETPTPSPPGGAQPGNPIEQPPPAVVGEQVAAARAALTNWNAHVRIVESPVPLPAGVAEDLVVVRAASQQRAASPESDAAVRTRPTNPVFLLELGCSVPDLQGRTPAEAQATTAGCGLSVASSASSESGLIDRQSPAAHELVAFGQVIHVFLRSDGAPSPSASPTNPAGTSGGATTEQPNSSDTSVGEHGSSRAIPLVLGGIAASIVLAGMALRILRRRRLGQPSAVRPNLVPVPGPFDIRVHAAPNDGGHSHTVRLAPIPGGGTVTLTPPEAEHSP
jgi:hypothetical protein